MARLTVVEQHAHDLAKKRTRKKGGRGGKKGEWKLAEHTDEENLLRWQMVQDLCKQYKSVSSAMYKLGYQGPTHYWHLKKWFENEYVPRKEHENTEKQRMMILEENDRKVREEKKALMKEMVKGVGDFDKERKEFLVRYKDNPFPALVCLDMNMIKEDSYDIWICEPLFAKKIKQLNEIAEDQVLKSMRDSAMGITETKVNPTSGMNFLKMINPVKYNPGSAGAGKQSKAKGPGKVVRGVSILKEKTS